MKSLLHWIAGTGSFEAWYDKVLLEKVVFNLLSNAFKYTPSGKDIRMLVKYIPAGELEESYRKEVAPSALYMMLQVVDAGCGIPLQERDKVVRHLSTGYLKRQG